MKEEIILHKDDKQTFVVFFDNNSKLLKKDPYVFYIEKRNNPLASAWKHFPTEKAAIEFGNNHIEQYKERIWNIHLKNFKMLGID